MMEPINISRYEMETLINVTLILYPMPPILTVKCCRSVISFSVKAPCDDQNENVNCDVKHPTIH